MQSADFLKTVENKLISRKLQLEEQLKTLKEDDPILAEMVIVPSEIGDSSWEAEVHAKSVVVSNNLSTLYQNIQRSLKKLQLGTYGVCERCGKVIEKERLQALPTASRCTLCL